MIAAVGAAGHGVESLDAEASPAPELPWIARMRSELIVATSGLAIAAGWAIDALGSERAATWLYALAIVIGGTMTWRRAALSLKARVLDMNVLMSVAVIGAAAIGEWSEGATVIFLFALGQYLEARAVGRTRSSIRALMDSAPEQASVKRGGVESRVPSAEVVVGDTIVVRPGERVPLDGEIVSGSSAFDESAITGESVPADRSAGDTVWAGTLSTWGLVEVRVTSPASDSALTRIVHLVEAAQATRAPVQRFVDRFSRIYTPIVVAAAAMIAFGVPALSYAGAPWPGFEAWDEWVYRALVLLVVSCPCALVIATPVAVVSAITRATRDGVLVKGGAFLELAAKVRAIAIDKTGTLTLGKPEVGEVVPIEAASAEELLAYGVALGSHSNHPVSRALARAGARTEGVVATAATGAGVDATADADAPSVTDVIEHPGRGVEATIDGRRLVLGRMAMLEGLTLAVGVAERMERESARIEEAGASLQVVFERDGNRARVLGLIGVSDTVRPAAVTTLAALKARGIEHIEVLTGDNERVARRVAESAGADGYRAGLLPEEKTEAVRALREQYGFVAMVGDGINDAPALAVADVGIAMGAAGSDIAIETADVALMRDDLAVVPGFFDLGGATMRIIRQNVWLSLATKGIVLVLAMQGSATLWMAVFADTGVALIVIANSLRLMGRPATRA